MIARSRKNETSTDNLEDVVLPNPTNFLSCFARIPETYVARGMALNTVVSLTSNIELSARSLALPGNASSRWFAFQFARKGGMTECGNYSWTFMAEYGVRNDQK